jgi:hypothetical protein
MHRDDPLACWLAGRRVCSRWERLRFSAHARLHLQNAFSRRNEKVKLKSAARQDAGIIERQRLSRRLPVSNPAGFEEPSHERYSSD